MANSEEEGDEGADKGGWERIDGEEGELPMKIRVQDKLKTTFLVLFLGSGFFLSKSSYLLICYSRSYIND